MEVMLQYGANSTAKTKVPTLIADDVGHVICLVTSKINFINKMQNVCVYRMD